MGKLNQVVLASALVSRAVVPATADSAAVASTTAGRVCCRAYNITCMACTKGLTEEQFCEQLIARDDKDKDEAEKGLTEDCKERFGSEEKKEENKSAAFGSYAVGTAFAAALL